MMKRKRKPEKREDFYPFVLTVTAVILGWAVVKTRDLEGALVLVKWVLLCAFLAVTCTLIPFYLTRLLWDRRYKSKTTPYYIKSKPTLLQSGFELAERKNARGLPACLLFPEGTRRSPLPEDYIPAYDATLGKLLKTDGVRFYTDDPAVIRYRAELFRELSENRGLRDALTRFAENYPSALSRRSFRHTLSDLKARHEAAKTLMKELEASAPRSEAMRSLKRTFSEHADAVKRTEEAFARLPDDLFRIQSVTLAVNLDSAGYPHEAGIVALHGEVFREGEPLVIPDKGRYDLTPELNRALMDGVDRALAEECRRLYVSLDELREAELSDELTEQLRFAAEFTALLESLNGCEIQFGTSESTSDGRAVSRAVCRAVSRADSRADGGGRDADLARLYEMRSLGYEWDFAEDGSGLSHLALKPFGCRVLAVRKSP
ncbi:MAG: hypothetical protein IKQ92_09750 [Clostridia bacterium]|nr:hypothetical protein [Clostridia bacterium]